MASFDPNRSTAQATTDPAGADSKAADCSSISSRNCVSSDLLATMLTFTTLSVSRPLEQCASARLTFPKPLLKTLPFSHNHYQENRNAPFPFHAGRSDGHGRHGPLLRTPNHLVVASCGRSAQLGLPCLTTIHD